MTYSKYKQSKIKEHVHKRQREAGHNLILIETWNITFTPEIKSLFSIFC